MKSVAYFALLPSLLTSVLAAFPTPEKVTTLPTVPNKFIIEVDQLANIPNKRSFKRSLDAIYSDLQARDIVYEVNKEFDVKGIFLGAALTINTAKDAIAVANTPGVMAIRPVKSFKAPELVQSHVLSGKDDPALPPDSYSTHVMTGVDKVHAEGNIGNGVKIGIIDTGIDYKHPALGGGFGQGFLVAGGYDFVGDAFTGDNQPVPDPDPYDNCAGHGTHVAGIIAAQPGNEFNITGVSYGATLYAYRVFGCDGSTSEEVIVDALLRGHQDGNDILTLSLGGADGWAASSSAIIASRIARAGKIVTIAAGNDGDSGSWYTSSPGNAIDAISVASVDNTVIPLQQAIVHGVTHDPITYYAILRLPVDNELPIYATSKDTTVANDACDPLPSDTPDLSSYLVIVRRGGCAFTQKLSNIGDKGGKFAFVYDNGNGFGGVELGDTAALIQAADGEFLVQQFAAGVPVTLSFPKSGASTSFPISTGGLVSPFSTYGPSNDFRFKPAVAAPGGSIVSTMPLDLGGFALLSGTSMATPFVAGVSALLFKAKGISADVAKGARNLFETTSSRIPSSHTDGALPHTLTQAGAGLIDAYKAIHTTTIVSPGELILNDTAHFKQIQTFVVKNTDKTTKNYKLTHVPAGTALTIQPNSIFAALGPVPTSDATATVSIFPSSFIVQPGESMTVHATFSPPSGLDASLYPVYSGAIEITSSGSDVTHVSYLGLAASLKDKQVVDNTDKFYGYKLPAILDGAKAVQTAPKNYTFANGDFPSLLWRLAFGTPALRVDLVDAAIQLTTTYNRRDLILDLGSLFTFPLFNPGGSYAQVKVIGPILSFNYISRHNEDPNVGHSLFNLQKPTFANGTVIANGAYRLLFRALRVTGDPSREEDYESWLSPIIGIQA